MSNKGGAREGAGRKKGTRSRRTLAQIARAVTSGLMPLDYMLRIMRDPTAGHDRRDKMAIAAAPYLHSKPVAAPVDQPSAPPVHYDDDEDGDLGEVPVELFGRGKR